MKDRKYILRKIKKFKNDYKKYKYIQGFLNGSIFSLISVIIYILLIIIGLFFYREKIMINLFIFPTIIFLVIAYFKRKSEREIIKKADSKLELEQRLITYYDYQNEKSRNPFFSSLENELATLLKKIPGQPIFKLNWQKYIQITALLLGMIIFLNSYFNIINNSNLRFDSTNNIFWEERRNEENYDYEKVEFINPLESNINNEIGEELSTIDSDEINEIEDRELNNEIDENFKKPELEENEKGDLGELEERLKKIEEEKKQKESDINMDGESEGENNNQKNSDLWKNQNNDRLVENENNIYKPGDEDNKNDEKGVDGPGGKSSENVTEEEGKEYQAIGENENSLSNSETINSEGSGNNGKSESDKTGLGAGENEGEFSNKDDFSNSLNIDESERLKSQFSGNNYLSTYLEEKYSSQNENEGDNILDSYLNYRNFLLDSVREENIPFNYQEMIKNYFIIIKD